jgi:hypothetical protein
MQYVLAGYINVMIQFSIVEYECSRPQVADGGTASDMEGSCE